MTEPPGGASTGGAPSDQPPPFGLPPGYGPPPPYGQPPGHGHPGGYAPPGYQPPGYPPVPMGQPPYPYPYPYQQTIGTNGLAIASMVLGILWIYWIGSVLALVFGYVARNQIRERNQGGDGMAIAGIVLGWIGIGTLILVVILAVSGATFFP